jgi:hypothetical protein
MLAVQGRVLVFFFGNPCKVFQVKKKKEKKRQGVESLALSFPPTLRVAGLPLSLSSKAVSSRYELRARFKRTAKLDRQGVESARFDLG